MTDQPTPDPYRPLYHPTCQADMLREQGRWAVEPETAPDDDAEPDVPMRNAIKAAVDEAWTKGVATHNYSPRARAEIAEAVLAIRDREMERLRQEIRRLGLTVQEYGTGASALNDKIKAVRDVIAERRTEVAEREVDGMLPFGTPGASWCDAVTVTCDRIDEALRQREPEGGIRDQPAPPQEPTVAECAADDRRWPEREWGGE